jgi:hypothetical protein
MNASLAQGSIVKRSAKYVGEVVYIFAFDVGYEIQRGGISELLRQPVEYFQMDTTKRAPRQFFFYRPQIVKLPALVRKIQKGQSAAGAGEEIRLERSVKIFPIGAISLTIRVPFAVDSLAELVPYHDLRFAEGYLYDEALATAEEVRRALAPHIVRPVEKLADEEAYTIFSLHMPASDSQDPSHHSEVWLEANRRQVAALLTEEECPDHLSAQEVEESTSRYLSYYDHDLIVVDWDAALAIDDPRYIDETLYLVELANLQLAELEFYDRILDEVVDRAYRDLAKHRLRGPGKTLRDLREIRVDLARLADELDNITKFFGDWHLARIYKTVADRFHLAEWRKSIDEKLRTLNDLYRILQEDRNHRMMLTLEIAVVVFFIIEIIPTVRGFFTGGGH